MEKRSGEEKSPRAGDDRPVSPFERCHTSSSPLAPPLVTSTVWRCSDTGQADRLLGGGEPGYVYRRNGHPNADHLAGRYSAMHHAACAFVTSSGMASLAAVLLAELTSGDEVLLADNVYGKTRALFIGEASRMGIGTRLVDASDVESLQAARTAATRMLVVETISNPLLQVAELDRLSAWCRDHAVRFVVDHTLATPFLCRPLEHGADYVVESLTKMLNGHSDVLAGAIAARGGADRLAEVITTWGLGCSSFDSWMACRGLQTFTLRARQANANALELAERLADHGAVERVHYPGLASHPDHETARRLFEDRGYGSLITVSLRGGRSQVDRVARHVPFCPSLGEVETTVSHPATTSHRGLSAVDRERLGITDGMLRISVGCESVDSIWNALRAGLEERDGSAC